MEFRLPTALVLAFLGAGCGDDEVSSPTAPTPPTTSAPVVQGLDIVNDSSEVRAGPPASHFASATDHVPPPC